MKPAVWGVLAACLTALPAALAASQDPPASALHAQAIEQYRAKNYQAAIPLYRQLAQQMPDNPDILQDLLWTLWYAEHYDEAIQTGVRLTALRPNDSTIWVLLGRCYYYRGQPESAREAFEKGLALDPLQPGLRLDIARTYIAQRDYNNAIRKLNELLHLSPDFRNAWIDLAKTLYLDGQFSDSADAWAHVMTFAAADPEYRFLEGQALYFAGKSARALTTLKQNLADNPDHNATFNFLVDSALIRNDFPTAEKLLKQELPGPAGDARLFRLAAMYQGRGNLEGCVDAMDSLLESDPDYGKALLIQADCLNEQGNLTDAIQRYQRVLAKNPWSFRVYRALADMESSRGRFQAALDYIRQARALDPTDPYLLFQEAQYIYAQGSRADSHAMLRKWVKANNAPRLPILLYHGLTPYRQDPILAHTIHIPTAVFEDHLRALRAAGFKPVTMEQAQSWIEGRGNLPKRPILITFDDARIDSFRYGDPLLKKYRWKATMTIPIVNIDKNLPGFASWTQLQAYQRTGRWEMQSHGNRGHEKIATHSDGRKDLYMPNKMWLDKQQRLETTPEWEARIILDMKQTNEEIRAHLGKTPVGFALPEGDYGQDNVPNFPEAAPLILQHSKTLYRALYTQDPIGINVRTRDPFFLRRVEPLARWKGRDLVRRLTDKDPVIAAKRILLRQAVWDNKTHEASAWLDELQKDGASQAVLWAEEARIRSAAGDEMRAWELASRALQLEPEDKETQYLVKSLEQKKRLTWTPEGEFFKDNRTRENWMFHQRLEIVSGRARWNLMQLHGSFSERGVPHVVDDAGGAGLTYPLGLHQTISVQGAGHFFSGAVKNSYSAETGLRSRWTDQWETTLRVARAPYPTARALSRDIFDVRYEARATGLFAQGWSTTLSGRAIDLSDRNQRYGGFWELARKLDYPAGLRVLYRFSLEDSDHVTPSYYCPQSLQQHQAGMDYRAPLSRSVQMNVRYLPGFGDETTTNWDFVQIADIDVDIRLGRTFSLIPSFTLTDTPTYNSKTYSLAARVLF